MQKEILEFISENKLKPYVNEITEIKSISSIYQTSHAKLIHQKTLNYISTHFNFKDTRQLFNFFTFTLDAEEIESRQRFFSNLNKIDYSFLKQLKKNQNKWHPPYGIIVVTANEATFITLKELDCPVKLIFSERDIEQLDNYDIVQAIDVEEYTRLFEQLSNVVFINGVDEVYLEKYLIELSEWKDNLNILKDKALPDEMKQIVLELYDLLELLEEVESKKITRETIEETLKKINIDLSLELKNMTLSGEALINLMSKGTLPLEITSKINQLISKANISPLFFNKGIPLSLDEEEIDKTLKKQDSQQFVKRAELIGDESTLIIKIPQKLKKLSEYLIFIDFVSGITKYLDSEMNYPLPANLLKIEKVKNIFIDNAQPISFELNREKSCSILTGANSGGKTTLLEHVIQINSLFQIGLPIKGTSQIPLFSEIYYFAKTKGAANKGAFETLLTQMATIKPGEHTLILADEIEAVTEPGVAGLIISATADYFIKRNSFLIIATHLGHEIKDILPEHARIDGIEAKGLDENFELIVDHNPVLGRLAHSTPELIVEKMAKSKKDKYFEYLYLYLNEHKKEKSN